MKGEFMDTSLDAKTAMKVGAIGLSTTFIGMIVGVGFASGQELMSFFGNFGIMGYVGVAIMGFGYFMLGLMGALTARRMNTPYYDVVFAPKNNKYFRWFSNAVVIVLGLFGVLPIMYAGGGSVLETQFGIPMMVGSIFTAVITYLSVIFGTRGFVNSLNATVPVLVITTVVICIYLFINPFPVEVEFTPISNNSLLQNWFISALLYLSYNVICGIAVVVPLGSLAKNEKSIIIGSLLSGVVLAVMAFFCAGAIIENYSLVKDADMPTVAMAQELSPVAGVIYSIAIYLAVFTTAAACLFALDVQLDRLFERVPKIKMSKPLALLIISVAAYMGSYIGFVTLVNVLYPFTGYFGFIVIAGLIYNFFTITIKKKKDKIS